MTTTHDPGLVSAELVAMTRALGGADRDLAILAEGNTSERLEDGRLVVKTSGSRMQDVTGRDFVAVEMSELTELLASANSTQADLTDALDAGEVDGRRRRGSIETLVHVAVQAVRPSVFVGHTHPTAVVGLLASKHAATAFDRTAYSDEAVVIGRPLFVPYAEPGIDLGKLVHRCLVDRMEAIDDFPHLILLGNHGIIATADTTAGVEAISQMAVKAARVRTIALSVGGLQPLPPQAVDKFFERSDITERRDNIARGRL